MQMELKCPYCGYSVCVERTRLVMAQEDGKFYVANKWLNPLAIDEYLTADPHDPREQYFVCDSCGYTEKVYEAYTVVGMIKGEDVKPQMKNE